MLLSLVSWSFFIEEDLLRSGDSVERRIQTRG